MDGKPTYCTLLSITPLPKVLCKTKDIILRFKLKTAADCCAGLERTEKAWEPLHLPSASNFQSIFPNDFFFLFSFLCAYSHQIHYLYTLLQRFQARVLGGGVVSKWFGSWSAVFQILSSLFSISDCVPARDWSWIAAVLLRVHIHGNFVTMMLPPHLYSAC